MRQVLPQRFGVLGGDGQLDTRLFPHLPGDGIQNGLLGSGTETGQRTNTPVSGRARQLFERMHVEFLVEHAHPLRTKAANLQQFGN
jgi:hypothetical protein